MLIALVLFALAFMVSATFAIQQRFLDEGTRGPERPEHYFRAMNDWTRE